MNKTIEQMLERYTIRNTIDEINALKEVIQEIILSGLSKGGFFDVAAFYGGTALRIFYGLDRFSEDLDFALVESDSNFDLSKYFSCVEDELMMYGINMNIQTKRKNRDTNIASAFLKGNTIEHIMRFFPKKESYSFDHILKDLKIKFEVDINPPPGATYDTVYKLLPSPHFIKLYDQSSLFAGKIHAVLCRGWRNRIKGRDLYDYSFYLSRNTAVNVELLRSKLIESRFIEQDSELDVEWIKSLLYQRFSEINLRQASEDVVPFIKDVTILDDWNAEYFIEMTSRLIANQK